MCTTLQYTWIHYTDYTTPQLQLQLQLHKLHYITTTAYNYNSTTLRLQLHLQLQLHYTTLHPAVVVRWRHCHCNHSKKHSSNHLSVHQWIRSAIRDVTTTNPSYRFPIFETSATAFCGTTVNERTYDMIEGSLEVKLPTIWTDEKQRWEESERREE